MQMFREKRHKIELIRNIFINFVILAGFIGIYYGIEFSLYYENPKKIECLISNMSQNDDDIMYCYSDIIDEFNEMSKSNCDDFAKHISKIYKYPGMSKDGICVNSYDFNNCSNCYDIYTNFAKIPPNFIFDGLFALAQITSYISISINVIYTIYIFIYYNYNHIKPALNRVYMPLPSLQHEQISDIFPNKNVANFVIFNFAAD